MKNRKHKIFAIPLIMCFFTIILFQFVFMLGYVSSKSMEPTISEGNIIIGLRIFKEIQRGDIVICEKDDHTIVKRVSGVPGDIIYILSETSTISVNVELENADRIVVIQERCYFLLGDNSNNSFDSRYWDDPLVKVECIKALLPRTNKMSFTSYNMDYMKLAISDLVRVYGTFLSITV